MLYIILFFFTLSVVVDEVLVSNRTNYQGCQIHVHFIYCQTSTDNSGIVNEFVQYVQTYFQSVYIPI